MTSEWTAHKIAANLAKQFFSDAICVCPNTYWTGYEADLLVVKQMKVIDVEIKTSRADRPRA